jgi:hypothetical protein
MINSQHTFVSSGKALSPSLYMDESYEQHSGRFENNAFTRIGALHRVCAITLAITAASPLPTVETQPKIAGMSPISHADNAPMPLDQCMRNSRHTALSSTLEKSFSFKKAQWASIISVERKTLYNWLSKPKTNVHLDTMRKLNTLNQLLSNMDAGHAQFLAKLSFGRISIQELRLALASKDASAQDLIDVYEKHYTTFDGLLKRSRHNLA